ncbi:PilN domain-containing protein, partial [Verrucomicrobiota bacterium]
DIPAETRDSLKVMKKMPTAPSMQNSEYQAVSLTALVGMALAPQDLEFNLVPDSVALKRGLIQKAKSLTTLGIMIMTLLVSVSLYSILKLYFTRNYLDDLTKKIEKSSTIVAKIEEKQNMVQLIRKRRDFRFSAVNLLSSIHSLVPAEIYLETLDVNILENQVIVAGWADSTRNVRAFIEKLKQLPLFKNVKESGPASMDKSAGKYRFQIICTMEKK